MGKAANKVRLAANEAQAILRNLRTSPRKLNDVATMIRGKKVGDAVTQLKFCHRRIAVDVRKTLESAIANAENNNNLDVDSLIVKEAYVGKSFTMKRFRARARGRGAKILKPYSHLTIVVQEVGESA